MKFTRIIVLLLVSLFVCINAFAGQHDIPVKAELLPVKYHSQHVYVALKFTIPHGWKVYSNNPGDSGLPIVIDFKGSTNIKNHDITWPPAEIMVDKLGDDEMKTNVYKKDTLIPIKLTPEDPTKPINVVAHVTYGACEKLCIGQDKKFKLNIKPNFMDIELKKQVFNVLHQCSGSKYPSHHTAAPQISLYMIMLFALLGGLILNLMPCVLPVLALKLLNIVKYAGLTKKQITMNLLATAFGIISTFVLLAAVTIVLKIIGVNFGWGFQFQEPWFLIFIAVILTIFAANLWGEFEVALPQWLNDASTSKKKFEYSINNSIAAGAFATLLATPCTAPFLSVSIAFALSQDEWTIMFIYMLVGIGMSIPYLLLAATPKSLKLLPKPGKWMVNLKKFFAVLLVITLTWILYILYYQISYYSLLVLIGCLILLKFALVNKLKKKRLK